MNAMLSLPKHPGSGEPDLEPKSKTMLDRRRIYIKKTTAQRNLMMNIKNLKAWLAALLLLILFSCRTEEEVLRPTFAEGTTESVNLWIKNQMQKYYYWNTQIPKNPDYSVPTPQFFKSLLAPEDRFSFAVNTKDPATYPRSVRGFYGFDYAVAAYAGQTFVVVKLVLDNSPAASAGLRRGMLITKINGTAVSASNAESLAASMAGFNRLDLTVGNWENGMVAGEKKISVYYGFTFEQPVKAAVFERNGIKAGYLYITDFRDGMSAAIAGKMGELKAAGVGELILDLRYNFGGSVASAAALCAMIPAGIKAESPFIKYVGNKNGGTVNQTFAEQIAFDPSAPAFATLHANNLKLNRVFVLTTRSTASAAEIVINNLKPYLNVVQIGETTRGKDMAGFPVVDEGQPKKISWELHPLIYKVYNIRGEGEYTKGIAPAIQADEFSAFPVLPLGSEHETLLQKALQQTGK